MLRFALSAAAATRKVRRGAPTRRRGIAIILVLGMIAMTLAVSYSLIRTQATAIRGTSNGELRAEARQAALSGLSAGLRRMNQSSNWAGADSTLTGSVNTYQSYSVAYATGDAAIAVNGPDAAKWPYRVTLTSTGFAVDPASSSTTTTYKVEAVAEMVPLNLNANPSPWSTMLNYVLYQTDTDDLGLQIPFRVNGPVRFQGSMSNFCSSYPSPTQARSKYLGDLNVMRTNGYADYRPFTGPITLPTSSTTGVVRNLFTNDLGVTLTNASGATTSGWSYPGTVTSYQLYPGGKSYNAQTLPSTIAGAAYQPDPRTNPAGLFYASGDVALGNNAAITGTVISGGKVRFTGTGSSIQAYSLPALNGSASVVQLPAVVAASDIIVGDGAGATIRGTVATFTKFQVTSGSENTQIDLQGNLICKQLDVQTRSDFNVGFGWWSLIWTLYNDQLSNFDRVLYFPVYCAAWGMNYVPRITIGPATGAATVQQWFTAGNPIYNANSGDTGLRWSVLRFQELP